MTQAQVLRLAAISTFRAFNDFDWNHWAGCMSEEPLICETDDYIIIIDGSVLSYMDVTSGDIEEQTFMLEQMGE